MQKICKKLTIFILPFLLSITCYADYSISPVKVVISPTEKVTSVNFTNETDKNKSFQISVYEEVKENNKEKYVEVKDLIVSPVVFSLKGGQTQLIRIAIKNDLAKEGDKYRISIKELPLKLPLAGNNVQVIPDFRLPVTISSAKEDSSEN